MSKLERPYKAVFTNRNEIDGQTLSLAPNIKFVVMEEKIIVNTSDKQKETNKRSTVSITVVFSNYAEICSMKMWGMKIYHGETTVQEEEESRESSYTIREEAGG